MHTELSHNSRTSFLFGKTSLIQTNACSYNLSTRNISNNISGRPERRRSKMIYLMCVLLQTFALHIHETCQTNCKHIHSLYMRTLTAMEINKHTYFISYMQVRSCVSSWQCRHSVAHACVL